MKKIKNSGPFVAKLSQLIALGAIATIIFLPEQTAQAQQWRFDPVVRVGYEFDDNAPLVPSPDSNDEIQGYLIDAFATIGAATERTTFDLTPKIRSRNYDEERFDSDDAFLRLNFSHEGLKSNFRIRANYAQESVRTAEREDADPDVNDPDEIAGDDSGRTIFTGDRNRFWILPQWSYNFSEKSAIAASVRYTDVDYDDNILAFFTPYSDVRLEASLTRGFSARTRGYVRVGAGRYKRDVEEVGAINELDGLGLTVGIEQGFTQTTRFRAEVGVVETEPNGGESDSDIVWDVNLVRNLETVTLLAQVKRSANSSGSGRVSLRDSLNLSMKKQFSERLQGGLGVRAYTTDKLSSELGSSEDRQYAQFRARIAYALSRKFLVEADYRYTYSDRSIVPENAKSNSIILWLTWRPTATTAFR